VDILITYPAHAFKNKLINSEEQSLQVLSNTLADLYDLAMRVPPQEFPAEVLRLLRPSIPFDGAAMRIGEIEIAMDYDFVTAQDHVYKRDWAAIGCRPGVVNYERVIKTFLSDVSRPFVGSCQEFYKDLAQPGLYNFSQLHDFHSLLLYGERPGADSAARWLVLYRGKTRDAFNSGDAIFLSALWEHLMRAVTINFRNALNKNDIKSQPASALINSQGIIEAADSAFSALLNLEWPDMKINALPHSVLDSLKSKSAYRGKRIRISMFPATQYMLCTASRILLLESLSPCEQTVAQLFASGISYKKIAQQLDMSPYTVRNHIANVYRKLDIHDKALLAALMSQTKPAPAAVPADHLTGFASQKRHALM
jgi:DNA-binding CsgD family transcriptional regulator